MGLSESEAPFGIVAIPAKNEAHHLGACLAALAMQRDAVGAPLPAGRFGILVLANDCTDDTVAVAERWAALSPHPIVVEAVHLRREEAHAGGARRRAMDLAAEHLRRAGRPDGVLMTTDADSCVSPTWVSATFAALAAGADAVAGYVDAEPAEIVALGPAFLRRGRLEDHYLRVAAEIHARCDPRRHDPWPNHRVSSGASLAVTLRAYEAIGGLPAVPVGEDAALTRLLDRHGFLVRHAMDVSVRTSCRFEGRAAGGAADTMRTRHENPDAPCDDDIEPAVLLLRRAIARGRLRRILEAQGDESALVRWAARLGLDRPALEALRTMAETASPLDACWDAAVAASPVLAARRTLTPNQITRELGRAERALRWLRRLGEAGPDPVVAVTPKAAVQPALTLASPPAGTA